MPQVNTSASEAQAPVRKRNPSLICQSQASHELGLAE